VLKRDFSRPAGAAARRDPVRQAGRSIDQVSQGRFLFGVGGGWKQDEMENHGTVYASRLKRMRESTASFSSS
jgi:alkanesulfonate monooxygenase SsuD/methylene tetrahydromethanopterin reductase-like flavin-dependent oxidoreductase (luciferase family)